MRNTAISLISPGSRAMDLPSRSTAMSSAGVSQRAVPRWGLRRVLGSPMPCLDGTAYFDKLISRSSPSTPAAAGATTGGKNKGGSKENTFDITPSTNSSTKLDRQRSSIWSSSSSSYHDLGQLGSGTYGVVYRASSAKGMVALKISRIDDDPQSGLPETTIREVVLLKELSGHPNILTFYDVSCSSQQEQLCIVTELLDMDLRAFIKRQKPGGGLPLSQVKTIAIAILNGIAHCHSNGVMHRDLKPHNILLSEDLRRIKIGDFGLARYNHDPSRTLTHEVVTLWYRPPEVLLGDCRYDRSVDLWSCGCIIAEMLTGRPLFPGDSEIDTLFKIFLALGTPSKTEWPQNALEAHENFPRFRGKGLPLPRDAEAFLATMLQTNPAKRCTAAQCLEHPWLYS